MKDWIQESDELVLLSNKKEFQYQSLMRAEIKTEINAFNVIKKLQWEGWSEK